MNSPNMALHALCISNPVVWICLLQLICTIIHACECMPMFFPFVLPLNDNLLDMLTVYYSTVVIAIGETVPEDPNLLNVIKEQFTKASHFLYTASRSRAYFKDIVILVPGIWQDDDKYENALWETFEDADFRIAHQDTPAAFTWGPVGCALQQWYIKISPSSLGPVSFVGSAQPTNLVK